MDGVRTSDWLFWGAIAIGGYFLWRFLSQGAQAVSSAVSATTGAIANPIANLWVSLTAQPNMTLLGSIQLPDGTEIPLANLPIRSDAQNNVYTSVGGITYQLHTWVLDAAGNQVYPAVPVGT